MISEIVITNRNTKRIIKLASKLDEQIAYTETTSKDQIGQWQPFCGIQRQIKHQQTHDIPT